MSELLTLAEVADLLRVSRWTIYALVSRGELRALRVGNRLRFRPEWLVAYAEAHATGPEADVREWFGVPDAGWASDRAMGTAEAGREAPPPPARARHRGRGVEGDAGRAAGRGTLELTVAAVDRKRRRIPRAVAE